MNLPNPCQYMGFWHFVICRVTTFHSYIFRVPDLVCISSAKIYSCHPVWQFASTYCRFYYPWDTHNAEQSPSHYVQRIYIKYQLIWKRFKYVWHTLNAHDVQNLNIWRPCRIFYKHPHALTLRDVLAIGLKYSEIYFRTKLLHYLIACQRCLGYN